MYHCQSTARSRRIFTDKIIYKIKLKTHAILTNMSNSLNVLSVSPFYFLISLTREGSLAIRFYVVVTLID